MKKLLSLLLSLALCLSILPTAAFATEGSGNTDSNKKIFLGIKTEKGTTTKSTSGGAPTAYGATHTQGRALCNCRIFCRNRLYQEKSIEI